jgi:hypothetical protein
VLCIGGQWDILTFRQEFELCSTEETLNTWKKFCLFYDISKIRAFHCRHPLHCFSQLEPTNCPRPVVTHSVVSAGSNPFWRVFIDLIVIFGNYSGLSHIKETVRMRAMEAYCNRERQVSNGCEESEEGRIDFYKYTRHALSAWWQTCLQACTELFIYVSIEDSWPPIVLFYFLLQHG